MAKRHGAQLKLGDCHHHGTPSYGGSYKRSVIPGVLFSLLWELLAGLGEQKTITNFRKRQSGPLELEFWRFPDENQSGISRTKFGCFFKSQIAAPREVLAFPDHIWLLADQLRTNSGLDSSRSQTKLAAQAATEVPRHNSTESHESLAAPSGLGSNPTSRRDC